MNRPSPHRPSPHESNLRPRARRGKSKLCPVLVLLLLTTCEPAAAARRGGSFRSPEDREERAPSALEERGSPPSPLVPPLLQRRRTRADLPVPAVPAVPAGPALAQGRETSSSRPASPPLLALADCAVAARGAWVASSASCRPPRELNLLDEIFGPLDRVEWLEDEGERPRLCWFRRRPDPGDGMATRCARLGFSLRRGRIGRIETRHVHAPLRDGRRPGFAAIHLGDEIWLSSWGPTARSASVRDMADASRRHLVDEEGRPRLPACDLARGERRLVVERPRPIALWAAGCYEGDLSPFLRIRRHALVMRPIDHPTGSRAGSAEGRFEVELRMDAATTEDARLLAALCRFRDGGGRRIYREGTRVRLALNLAASEIDRCRRDDEELLQESLLP